MPGTMRSGCHASLVRRARVRGSPVRLEPLPEGHTGDLAEATEVDRPGTSSRWCLALRRSMPTFRRSSPASSWDRGVDVRGRVEDSVVLEVAVRDQLGVGGRLGPAPVVHALPTGLRGSPLHLATPEQVPPGGLPEGFVRSPGPRPGTFMKNFYCHRGVERGQEPTRPRRRRSRRGRFPGFVGPCCQAWTFQVRVVLRVLAMAGSRTSSVGSVTTTVRRCGCESRMWRRSSETRTVSSPAW